MHAISQQTQLKNISVCKIEELSVGDKCLYYYPLQAVNYLQSDDAIQIYHLKPKREAVPGELVTVIPNREYMGPEKCSSVPAVKSNFHHPRKPRLHLGTLIS